MSKLIKSCTSSILPHDLAANRSILARLFSCIFVTVLYCVALFRLLIVVFIYVFRFWFLLRSFHLSGPCTSVFKPDLLCYERNRNGVTQLCQFKQPSQARKLRRLIRGKEDKPIVMKWLRENMPRWTQFKLASFERLRNWENFRIVQFIATALKSVLKWVKSQRWLCMEYL